MSTTSWRDFSTISFPASRMCWLSSRLFTLSMSAAFSWFSITSVFSRLQASSPLPSAKSVFAMSIVTPGLSAPDRPSISSPASRMAASAPWRSPIFRQAMAFTTAVCTAACASSGNSCLPRSSTASASRGSSFSASTLARSAKFDALLCIEFSLDLIADS